MVLTIFALVLVLGIAFYQSAHGTFSALIMALLSMCCAALAMNYYEPLAQALLASSLPTYANAIALVGLFGIPLIGLRLLADRFIPGNVLLGIWPDRIAGGLLGLVTGLVCTGILTIGLQLLPWTDDVLGYRPFDDTLKRDQSLAPLYPDEFVIGMSNMLSTGALEGDPVRPWNKRHDDLLLELHCARNTGKTQEPKAPIGKEVPVNLIGGVQSDSLKVLGAYLPPERADLPQWADEVPAYPFFTDKEKLAGQKIVIVRCNIAENTKTPGGNAYNITPTQFRLVTNTGRSLYPLGYLTYSGTVTPENKTPWMFHSVGQDKENKVAIGSQALMRPVEGSAGLVVDWVYRKPANENLDYVTFRGLASDSVPAIKPNEMPASATALKRKTSNY
jgi:hypothetical protein